MKSISEFFCEYKKHKEQRKIERIINRAAEIYQITEYNGQLWFTCDSFLYCPCLMMGDDAINALSALRQKYIDRHTKL